MDREDVPRVVFLHGLESTPSGAKVKHLRAAGFEVVAPDFSMGTTQWSRRNSVVRMLSRLLELRLLALAAVASLGLFAAGYALEAAAALGLCVAWFLARRKAMVAAAVRKSFAACVALAAAAVEETGPDVLIGSSWGGAVATELVRSGRYAGPTILLAPATLRVEAWMERGDARQRNELLRERARSMRVVIFHDASDDVVPVSDSRQLADGGAMSLRVVEAGGHRLGGLLTSGALAEAVRGLTNRSAS